MVLQIEKINETVIKLKKDSEEQYFPRDLSDMTINNTATQFLLQERKM